jgi:ABC-type antimicrobial peptide transport system permease subunit
MENNKTVVSSGIGFGGLLTIVFITLKLTGVISWPWVWVLSPLWIPVALIFAICILCIAGVLIKLLRANKA